MSRRRPHVDAGGYIDAARRKVEVAYFHLDRLKTALGEAEAGVSIPPIPVQAYFEGVVISAMAAVDQTAQATNSALSLGLDAQDLVDGAFRKLRERVAPVGQWFDKPIGRDLRRIRTRMVHYAYSKTPQGVRWSVEDADSEYEGSRHLDDYAEAAAEYLRELESLLPNIRQGIGA